MRERRVAAVGLELAVAEWPGQGPPLVLLHGIGSRGTSWQPVAPRLAERFHLYALDLRGHGASDKPPAGYLLADYAADLAAVVDRLGLARPLVVGHSLGALVALTWAAAEPERAAGLVLEDPPLRTEPEILEAFAGWQRLNAAPLEQVEAWFAAEYPDWTPEERRRRAESITLTHPAVFAELRADAEAALASGRVERLDSLAPVQAPTLVLRGERALGSMTRPEDLAKLRRVVPTATERVLPGTGHHLHRQQPEAFTATVAAFFAVGEERGLTVPAGAAQNRAAEAIPLGGIV